MSEGPYIFETNKLFDTKTQPKAVGIYEAIEGGDITIVIKYYGKRINVVGINNPFPLMRSRDINSLLLH
mgnify:CR=1 FL=1